MIEKMKKVLDEMLVTLKLANTLLKYLVWRLTVRPPGFGKCVQVSEELINMSQVFTYRQGLLPVKPGVASQRLVVTVDGVAQEPIPIAADATEVDFKAGPAGGTVNRSLRYLDAAGNESDSVEAPPFVIVDGIPPEAPEGFGELKQIAEEQV